MRDMASTIAILSRNAANAFYNTIYASSKQDIRGDVSITDIYLSKVRKYVMGMKTYPECYKYVVDGLYRDFLTQSSVGSSTFSRFVDKVLENFIPPEYHSALSGTQKDEMLSAIVCDLFSGLGSFVTRPEILRGVIDGRTGTAVPQFLVSEASRILATKKAAIHHMIIEKSSQSKEFISNDVADSMREEIAKLTDENVRMKRDLLSKAATIREYETEKKKYLELIKVLHLALGTKAAKPAPAAPSPSPSPAPSVSVFQSRGYAPVAPPPSVASRPSVPISLSQIRERLEPSPPAPSVSIFREHGGSKPKVLELDEEAEVEMPPERKVEQWQKDVPIRGPPSLQGSTSPMEDLLGEPGAFNMDEIDI